MDAKEKQNMQNELFSWFFGDEESLETLKRTTPCLVCGEEIEIGINDETTQICPSCKAAILALRRSMERLSETKGVCFDSAADAKPKP